MTQEPWPDGWQEVARGRTLEGVEMMELLCPDGHSKEVRTDSFLPGAHVLNCVRCRFSSSSVRLASGQTFEVTDEARAASGA